MTGAAPAARRRNLAAAGFAVGVAPPPAGTCCAKGPRRPSACAGCRAAGTAGVPPRLPVVR